MIRISTKLLARSFTPMSRASSSSHPLSLLTTRTTPTASRSFSLSSRHSAEKLSITFNTTEGDSYQVWASEGESLLDVVINKDIPLDGFGACEGTVACSTCHVIVTPEVFDALPEATEDELDMLDLAQDLCDHSRLGCQIILKPEHDGLTVTIPSAGRDARTL